MTRLSHRDISLLIVLLGSGLASAVDEPLVPAGPITIQPPAVELRHQRQPQSLQVLAATADGYSIDLREQATFASADPNIATIDAAGWIRPVANGQTQVTVTAAGQIIAVPVTVALPPAEPPMSF